MKKFASILTALAATLALSTAHAGSVNLLPGGPVADMPADVPVVLLVGHEGAGTLDVTVTPDAGAASSVFSIYDGLGLTKVFSETLPAGGGITDISVPLADLTAGPLVFSDVTSATHGFSADGWSLDSATFVTTPVPEPQTYALMIAGLAAVGFVASRRRRG